MGNYKMEKALTLLNSTFKNGYYGIIGASFVIILLLISQGKTKNSVEINRNKMGKEHSHDTATVENNSFIEYSCTTFKEVHWSLKEFMG